MPERKYNHVAVLLGGWSAEREVSLASGACCAAALREAGYEVTEVDVDRDIVATLQALKPDVCFNILHGHFGEDGGMQAILEMLEIPYTHSGVLASALAMDKERAKIVMKAVGVPVAESRVVDMSRLAAGEESIARPFVLKPVAEGSSVGVFLVREDSNFNPDVILADSKLRRYRWMAERYVPGLELTCAVMGETPLGVTEILPAENLAFYDYEAKYAAGGSRHVIPARISPDIYRSIERLSLAAHQALGCRGVSRSDFRLDERADGSFELICLEVNTQPGMTATSLVPEQAAHKGMPLAELVHWMVEDASCNR
ncbi:MAG: D-alanine--D-alanine ligase [Rhizobiales bacterium]|nr:D-alanine--D-alanine ligase [Hyphomicrobiales bacterium]